MSDNTNGLPRLTLYLDAATGKLCRGWAFDKASPESRLMVTIASADGPVTYCRAGLFREDLKAAAVGNGSHGFEADISKGVFPDGVLTATVTGSDGSTASATITVPPPDTDASFAAYFHGRSWQAEYQDLMAQALRRPARRGGAAAGGPTQAPGPGYASRAVPDKLFATPPELAADPGNLVSNYLAFECYRNRVDGHLDLHGDALEFLRLMEWYLNAYLHHRGRKLPLSARQIEFLNAPLLALHHAHKISVVSAYFIRQNLGPNWDLANPTAAKEAIYWWCTERAPELNLQDSLVTDSYIDLMLAAGPAQRWTRFHTNYFVERFHALHPELHFLDLTISQDRAFLAAYLVALCGQRPDLVRFLPRESVGRLLSPRDGGPGPTLLDEILQLALAPPSAAPEANELPKAGMAARTALVEAITRTGHSLKLGRRMGRSDTHDSAECLDDHGPIPGPAPGMAVIGPLRASSGLGQATRLSVAVLKLAEPDVLRHDFDMDNPAPVEAPQDEPDEAMAARAINLIHLNAETIPLAFAYLPQDLYRRSYNIGFFFWELTELPKCHGLALEMLDEVWVASEYDRAIYAARTDIPVVNVGMAVQPLPELPAIGRAFFGIPEGTFVLLATFDSFSFVERKNPLAVVRAFQLAFPPGQADVMLILKTQNRHKVDDAYQVKVWNRIARLCERDPRIVVMNDTLRYAELLALKRSVDCYVSLHRSEGWGFGMIEAMQLGVPVIATGYSGNMEFCNPATALLVGYQLVQPRPDEYIFVERGSLWADPSIEEAASHMRTAFHDRRKTAAIAANAKGLVDTSFSPEAIGRRYAARIAEIRTRMGQDPDGVRSTPSP